MAEMTLHEILSPVNWSPEEQAFYDVVDPNPIWMNWLIKPSDDGRWIISFNATYFARHDGTVKSFNDDNVSCFWPTFKAAASSLRRLRDVLTANCLALPNGPDPRFLVGSAR